MQQLTQEFPILSIEDGMAENDWEGWKLLTDRFKNKVQIVGKSKQARFRVRIDWQNTTNFCALKKIWAMPHNMPAAALFTICGDGNFAILIFLFGDE